MASPRGLHHIRDSKPNFFARANNVCWVVGATGRQTDVCRALLGRMLTRSASLAQGRNWNLALAGHRHCTHVEYRIYVRRTAFFRAHSARSRYHGWYTIAPQYTGSDIAAYLPNMHVARRSCDEGAVGASAQYHNLQALYIVRSERPAAPTRNPRLCTRIVPHTMCSVRIIPLTLPPGR